MPPANQATARDGSMARLLLVLQQPCTCVVVVSLSHLLERILVAA